MRNTRLVDSLMRQAMSALSPSPGARAYYDRQCARREPHNAALRHLANRLVGILQGCLTSRTTYDETTAWAHQAAAARPLDPSDVLWFANHEPEPREGVRMSMRKAEKQVETNLYLLL